MGAFTTNCPSCSTPNEVDTDILSPGASVISCWSCASQVPITQAAIAEARRRPSIHARENTSMQARISAISRANRAGGGMSFKLVFGIAGLVVLLLVLAVLVVAVLRVVGSGGGSSGSQFRAAYHVGEEIPNGTKGWQVEVAPDNDFALARSGDVIIAAANERRSDESSEYDPGELSEDLLEPIRSLHAKMLANGYEPVRLPEKTALQEDQNQRFQTKLEKGTCYQLAVIGGEKVQDADLLLYHADGVRLILADTRGERDAILEHCPLEAESFEYEVRMHRGFGLVATLLYRQTDRPFHNQGHLYGLKVADGGQRWTTPVDSEISSSPSADDRFIAVGIRSKRRSKATRETIEGGGVSVHRVADGESVCTFDALGPVLSTPLIVDGVAYFGSCGTKNIPDGTQVCDPRSSVASRFSAVRLESCELVWFHETSAPVVEAPTTDGRRIYFPAGSKIIALDADVGSLAWTKEATTIPTGASVSNEFVVFGSRDGAVRALDASTGELRWVYEAEVEIRSVPAIVEQSIFIGGADGSIFALDLNSGERLWNVRADTPIRAPISVAANVAFGLASDRLLVANVETGTERFIFPFGEGNIERSAPLLVNGSILFSDGHGQVISVR